MTAFSAFIHKIWIWQITALQSQLQEFFNFTKTDDRYQLFCIFFTNILARQMTASQLSWHKIWAWQMTDYSFFWVFHHNLNHDRWQLFFCHVCDFWPWQMTDFQLQCPKFNHDRQQILKFSLKGKKLQQKSSSHNSSQYLLLSKYLTIFTMTDR